CRDDRRSGAPSKYRGGVTAYCRPNRELEERGTLAAIREITIEEVLFAQKAASPMDRRHRQKEAQMLTEERLIGRQGTRYWWLFLVTGIAWLLIAWIVLRLNQTSIATVGVLIGVVFLVSAVNEVGLAILAPG